MIWGYKDIYLGLVKIQMDNMFYHRLQENSLNKQLHLPNGVKTRPSDGCIWLVTRLSCADMRRPRYNHLFI